MGSLGGGPLKVALVQTAMTLPFFVFALPAGAAGDLVDRRRLLLVAQSAMLAGSALLALLTFAGAMSPWALLVLMFAIGTGQAVTAPSWQALQPALVARDEIDQAAALGGMSINLARAIGPALGGALVALAGAGWVFALNALSFLGVLAVLALWRRSPGGAPPQGDAFHRVVVAGVRYLADSAPLRAILARTALFAIAASGVWALLPVLARDELGLGSTGYGLLLAAVGLGAIGGAWLLPWLRARLSLDAIAVYGAVAFALACVGIAWAPAVPLTAACLVLTGVVWICVFGSLNGRTQSVLPDAVRSRGMALYLLAFIGGQAFGGAVWGGVAQALDARAALTLMAVALVAGIVTGRRWTLAH
jgi:MFS family permease